MKKKILLLAVISFIIHCLIFINHCKAQWVQMSNGMGTDKPVYALCASDGIVFAGTGQYGVYKSSNSGTNWIQTGLINQTIWALSSLGNNIFTGTWGNGIYISANNGSNWTQTMNSQYVWSFAVIGGNIFAGTGGNGVYRSTNNGSNWYQTTLNDKSVYALTSIGSNLFAGTLYGVYLSTNNGVNWAQPTLNNQNINCLTALGNNILAGTNGNGVFLSSNNGQNWIQTALNNKIIYSLCTSGNNIIAGTRLYGIYLSTNSGASWTDKNEGFNSLPNVGALLIVNNYIYAGTEDYSVWRRELSEIIGIINISTEIPSGFKLYQNYPNPFNPVTKIRFEVPLNKGGLKGVVSLKVFDLLGREVATLVNEKLNPGIYEVDWDASQFTSGVYFYQLRSGSYVETKKLILLK